MIERATMDNAIKRALRFEAQVILNFPNIIPTSFVIVRCLKTGLVCLPLLCFHKSCNPHTLALFLLKIQMLTHFWLLKFAVSTLNNRSWKFIGGYQLHCLVRRANSITQWFLHPRWTKCKWKTGCVEPQLGVCHPKYKVYNSTWCTLHLTRWQSTTDWVHKYFANSGTLHWLTRERRSKDCNFIPCVSGFFPLLQ